MPTAPDPTPWDFALERVPDGEDLIGVGADLTVETLYEAYSTGIFPMGIGEHGAEPMGWWCPDPRGVLRLGELRVSRSLRQSARRVRTSVDTAFSDVIRACADPGREGRWITPTMIRAYEALHEAGWAHSVEVWDDDRLVGGLYGVAIGGLFAGESMFHEQRDASKVALLALHELLAADGDARRIVDVQWRTDHLATLGVTEVPRRDYLRLLDEALRAPLPRPWA